MRYVLALLLCSFGATAADETVVNNMGNVESIAFTEDLRISDEKGEDYLWGSIQTDIAVTNKGEILVADPNTNELRLYDSAGKFVRVVASKGSGPGELEALNKVEVLPDGRLFVFESKPMYLTRIQIFDQEYKLLKVIRPGSMVSNPIYATIAPSGEKFAGITMQFDMTNGQMTTSTGFMDMNTFTLETNFSSVSQRMDAAMFQNPEGFGTFIADMLNGFFAGSGVFAFNADGTCYSAMSNKYEITRWAPDLKTKQLSFTREHKPTLNTEDQLRAVVDRMMDGFKEGPFGPMMNASFADQVIKKAEPPQVKSPVEGLIAMEDGYLMVIDKVDYITGEQTAEIFDPKGKVIGSLSMDNWALVDPNQAVRMVFKNGMAYTVEMDDEESLSVVRYRYKLPKK